MGSKIPSIVFDLLVLETGVTDLDSSSLGLVDLDILRKAESGYDGTAIKGLYVWLRDTSGDYFIRHWKGGYLTNLSINRIQGFQNQIGSTLYKVNFSFDASFMAGADHHKLIRW